jgi:hypothetical protein
MEGGRIWLTRGAHSCGKGCAQLWKGARTGKARARMGGEGGAHGSERGYTQQGGEVRTGYGKGTHGWGWGRARW